MIFTCFLQFHSSVVKDLLAAIEGGSTRGKHLHEPRESDKGATRGGAKGAEAPPLACQIQ